MRRNIRFWTRFTWESASVGLFLTALLAAISILRTDRLDFSLLASVVPYFLCISAVFCMMMINTGAQTLYVPLLVSMGEPRRNVLLGFHYYRALIIAVTIGLCALVWLLVPGEVSRLGLRSIPVLFFCLLAASAFGSLLGTLMVKWKWVGTILIILLCGGAGGIFGMTAAAGGGLARADTVELASYLTRLPWQLAAGALVVFAADVVFQWLLLRRLEVKL